MYDVIVDIVVWTLIVYAIGIRLPYFFIGLKRFIKDDSTLQVSDFVRTLNKKGTVIGFIDSDDEMQSCPILVFLGLLLDLFVAMLFALVWPLTLGILAVVGFAFILRSIDRLGRRVGKLRAVAHTHPESVKYTNLED